MFNLNERTGVEAGMASWVARHRFAGPLTWGLASGLTGGPLFFGSFLPGWAMGLAGGGAQRVWLSIGGMFAGFALVVGFVIVSSMDTCPSCVDAVIVAPFSFIFLLLPYAVGYWFGLRRRRRWESGS